MQKRSYPTLLVPNALYDALNRLKNDLRFFAPFSTFGHGRQKCPWIALIRVFRAVKRLERSSACSEHPTARFRSSVRFFKSGGRCRPAVVFAELDFQLVRAAWLSARS